MRTIVGLLAVLGAAAAAPPGCRERAGAPAPGRKDERRHDSADWCAPHGVPESACTICNPDLIPEFRRRGDWCAEHGLPESVCPVCRPANLEGRPPPTAPPLAPREDAAPPVRLADPGVEAAAGIVSRPAALVRTTDGITCFGRIAYDPHRVGIVASRTTGTVVRLPARIGSLVAAGLPIAAVRSPEVGEARARLRAARAAHELAQSLLDRESRLREIGVNTEREVAERRVALEQARADLSVAAEAARLLGDEPEAGAGAPSSRGICGDEPACATLRAPFAGVVTALATHEGAFVRAGDPIAEVTDVSVVWAMLDVRDADLPRLRAMTDPVAVLAVDGAAGAAFEMPVAGVEPEIDPRSRMARARIEGIDNADGRLRVGMFVRATIRPAAARTAVTVPRDAVHAVDGETLAFVRLGPGLFEPRRVRVADLGSGVVEVLEGIATGEPVVVEGGFLLKTEMLRDRIGAGCAEDH